MKNARIIERLDFEQVEDFYHSIIVSFWDDDIEEVSNDGLVLFNMYLSLAAWTEEEFWETVGEGCVCPHHHHDEKDITELPELDKSDENKLKAN